MKGEPVRYSTRSVLDEAAARCNCGESQRGIPTGRRASGVERIDLQFRAEFFNLFNIVNLGLPANTLTGAGFGKISRTAGREFIYRDRGL